MTDQFAIESSHWSGLSKLNEECGEVIQIVGKILGTKGETTHFGGSDLRVRLEEELADLLAAIDFFCENNVLSGDPLAIAKRRQAKLARFREWGGYEYGESER